MEWMEWGRGLIISGVLRGRSVGKILEMLWSWGVVAASLYGELEGSLSIMWVGHFGKSGTQEFWNLWEGVWVSCDSGGHPMV